MVAAFALLEARVGAAVMRSLANAQAAIGGAPLAPAIFDRAPRAGELAGIGVHARDIAITVDAAAAAGAARGTAVVVYFGDQIITPAGSYVVREVGDADLEAGLTTLLLEAP